jgi:hypothetical protein
MSYSLPSAKYLIPYDLKRSTIRRRNPKKEEQIERIGELQHYWMPRTPESLHLGTMDVKRLTIIEEPILELVWNGPPHLIYMEGFGGDRFSMQMFFLKMYPEEIIGAENQFYMVEWYPKLRYEG